MLLRKHLLLSDVSLKLASDGAGTFEGYASVFGGVDSYGDTIIKGAFESTLRTNGLPKMFFQHDWGMPIGKWTSAEEDDKGLYVKGELTPGLALAGDVHAALKHGTLDGLSIGGYVKQGDYDTTETGRVIRKWSRLVEVSPVVFPADPAAKIDSETVKGAEFLEAIQAVESIRDLESLLRDAAGLSKGAATALVARAKAILAPQGEPDGAAEAKAMQSLAERLQRLAA
jgi:HK97 family phage prohead protease